MSCDGIQRQLTAYLEGELEDERGSVVRGHLRGCAACRQIASDEARVRDALRALPTVDPPAGLWAGVQAQLAAAEIADSERPSWRRALTRWMPVLPRLGAAGLAAAAAGAILYVRAQPGGVGPTAPAPAVIAAPAPVLPAADITAALAAEATQRTDTHADVAEELMALAAEARAAWPPAQAEAFDASVAELRTRIDRAEAGRPRQQAWRALTRYLQRAVVRDDVALAAGVPGGAP